MIMMLLMPTMPGHQRAKSHEPDEDVDAGEEAIDALGGLRHVEGADAAIIVR
jgi:hypothetical protein